MAVIMKNAVFWVVTPCVVRRKLVTANVIPSSPILVTLMMEALRSSECRFLQIPRGITSQKTAFFFVWTLFSLLWDNLETREKYTNTLTDANGNVGLETNVEETRYLLLSRHQNAVEIGT
jgi:hypothetical protein